MSANLKNSIVATGLEKISFHSNPKEGQFEKLFILLYNFPHFTFWRVYAQNPSSQSSAVHELRTFMNLELPKVQAGLWKGRGTRDQIVNMHWIMEKAREFQKNIHLCFICYVKAFDCVDYNKLENSSWDGSTRRPYLSSEKPVSGSRSTS